MLKKVGAWKRQGHKNKNKNIASNGLPIRVESVKLVVEHVSLQEPKLSIYQTLVYEDIVDPFDSTDFLIMFNVYNSEDCNMYNPS